MKIQTGELSGGAKLAQDMWFRGQRDYGPIEKISLSSRAAYAETALAAYELGLDSTAIEHERASAARLSDEIYGYIADHPELSDAEVEALGDLAETLARAAVSQEGSVICDEPSGYREFLTDMADEALARASTRLSI